MFQTQTLFVTAKNLRKPFAMLKEINEVLWSFKKKKDGKSVVSQSWIIWCLPNIFRGKKKIIFQGQKC